jgi:hypothetical protein
VEHPPRIQVYFAGKKHEPWLTDVREQVQAHYLLMMYSKHNATYNFKNFTAWPENHNDYTAEAINQEAEPVPITMQEHTNEEGEGEDEDESPWADGVVPDEQELESGEDDGEGGEEEGGDPEISSGPSVVAEGSMTEDEFDEL